MPEENEFEEEVKKQIKDITDGGFIINDWDINKDTEWYMNLVMEGKSGKKYRVYTTIDSVDEED